MLVLIVCGLLPAIAIQCYARFTSSGTATATKTLVLDHISKLCVSSHAVSCHCTLLRVRASRVLTWCSKFDVLPNSRVRLVMAGTNAGQNIAAGEAGRLEHEEARNARIQAEQG